MTTGKQTMTFRIPRLFWRHSCVMALCVMLSIAAGCSNRRSEQFRGEGDALLKLGRVEEAQEAYNRSAETNPKNPMAQLGLARCAAFSGDTEGALSLYETVRALAPEMEESYLEPVRLQVEAGHMEEALNSAESLAQISPEKGGLLHAAVLLKAKRNAEAIERLSTLHQSFPDSKEVSLNLGVAYAEDGQLVLASPLLWDVARAGAAPLSAAAQMALISSYHGAGRITELLGDFKELASSRTEDSGVQLGYARVLLLANRMEEAEVIARPVLDREPKNGWANYIVGAAELRQGNREEAVVFLENAARALPEENEIGTVLEIARTTTPIESNQDASTPPATAAEGHGESPSWHDLWKQAALRRLLDDRDDILADGSVSTRETLTLAAVFMQNSSLAHALSEGLPDDSRIAQFMRAMDAHDAGKIRQFFEDWDPSEPDQRLLRDNALGYAMASAGSRGQALSVFLLCLERWPDNVVALFNIAQVFRSIRQPVIAAQQLQRLIVQYPDNIDAHQMLYTSLREGGAFEQARKAAETSFTLFPEDKWSFLNLCQAYLDTEDADLAMEVLSRGITLFPNDAELMLAMAGVLVQKGDCDGARRTLDGIVTSAPAIIAQRAALTSLCAALAQDWSAVAAAAKSTDPATWSDSLALLAFLAACETGDPAAAGAALKTDDANAPRAGTLGRLLLTAIGQSSDPLHADESSWAAILADNPTLLRDYTCLNALQRARLYDGMWNYYSQHFSDGPPHIAVAQLAFSALARCRNADDPKSEGNMIANKLHDDARAWLGLAEMLRERGDDAGQEEAIKEAKAVAPDNPEVWYRQAVLQEKQGDFEGSATSYRKLLALQPDSPIAKNNLAYMLLKIGGHDEEALGLAQLAQEKLKNNPGVLHTLGRAQMRLGDYEASRKSLEVATEIDPANPTIMFDYGRVLLDLGNKDDAKKRIHYALAMSTRAGIEFPEQSEAESLLETLE